MSMKIFSVGHSNHPIEVFIGLLKKHEISAIADVRSYPYSRRFPQFSQVALKDALKASGIAYVFLGDELGARPSDPTCYLNGKALYERIAKTEAFTKGINRILRGAENHNIALMCAEQDPIVCHRAILVCHHLREAEIEILHILKNGEIEPQEHLEGRLLKLHNLNYKLPLSEDSSTSEKQLNLFSINSSSDTIEQASDKTQPSYKELIEIAYQLQGDRIAYVEKESST